MTRLAWLDCAMGASGDMLLGALLGLGGEVAAAVTGAVEALGVGARVDAEPVERAGLAATRAVVSVPAGEQPPRRLADLLALVTAAQLPPGVAERAAAAFTALAAAEAHVHGSSLEEVHFHEVGALDALADVVGTCAGFGALDAEVHAGPPALGGPPGPGPLPVPAPAVLALLAAGGIPARGGPLPGELLTPTGAALLLTWVDHWGDLPAMVPGVVSTGAGGRDVPGRPNVLRLVVGTPATATRPAGGAPDAATGGAPGAAPDAAVEPAPGWWLLECTVDDLDPRIWPGTLSALAAAGAADSWLTPVLMKKGRPGHVLTALVAAEHRAGVRQAMFRETSTLGVRETALAARTALDRRVQTVQVAGQPVRVKLGTDADGTVLHAMPEWEDVAAAAAALGRPARQVLAEAAGLAARWLG